MDSKLPASQAAEAPASLIAEVYDCLMQASRKQLAQLLSVLVKACPASVLEQVRNEAMKTGALVASSSRFQQFNHQMLDCFFSFLEERDLYVVEMVCARWRVACK